MKIIWTHEALGRLEQIKNYISKDSPTRASQFIQQIIDRTKKLSHNPGLGSIVPEISNPDIRELIFKNYRIVYRMTQEHIEILTVFEGHMLLRIHDINN
jgi:toxin ParE1/3/4